MRKWVWPDIQDIVVETDSPPPRQRVRLCGSQGRKTTCPTSANAICRISTPCDPGSPDGAEPQSVSFAMIRKTRPSPGPARTQPRSRVTAQEAAATAPATENTAGQAPIFLASGWDPANAAT